MDPTNVPEPVAKRADQLVVGDRISGERLPAFSSSDADVVFVRKYELHGEWWVFVAYLPDDGNYDSVTYRADGEIEVVAQAKPAQPVAERPLVGEGGVWAVPVAGGLIEVDPPEGFVPAGALPKPVSTAGCGCPVYPFPQGRGDAADTIVEHLPGCSADGL